MTGGIQAGVPDSIAGPSFSRAGLKARLAEAVAGRDAAFAGRDAAAAERDVAVTERNKAVAALAVFRAAFPSLSGVR